MLVRPIRNTGDRTISGVIRSIGPTSAVVLASLCLAVSAPGLSAQDTARIDELGRLIELQQVQLDELKSQLEELKAQAAEKKATEEAAAPYEEPGKTLPGPLIVGKNENLTFKLSGRVHRMILTVDDGADTSLLFTDSEQGPTMLRADAEGKPYDRLAIGSTIEIGVRQNRPFQVSQDEPDPGTDITVRIAEVFLNSTGAGKFSLGRGFAAAWLAPEVDLSGTQFADLLPVGMLAPGLKFVDASTGELSEIRVRDHFVDVERLLLVDRFRYDSPRFAGVKLSGSIAADDRWDLALRTRHTPGKWTVVAGASYQDQPFMGIDRRTDGVFSIRHEPTGVNFTAGASDEKLTEGRTADSYIVKFGWLADIFGIGKTAFATDYFQVDNLRLEGDESESFGLFVVQKWPGFGMDFYAGIRRYRIRRSDINLEPLLVVPLGVVLNF